MARYEAQSDGCLVICPYCGSSYQRESEDYSTDERVETCDSCGKKYHTADEFSVEHTTRPDCGLNAEPHRWRAITPDWRACEVCGHVEPGEVVPAGSCAANAGADACGTGGR